MLFLLSINQPHSAHNSSPTTDKWQDVFNQFVTEQSVSPGGGWLVFIKPLIFVQEEVFSLLLDDIPAP